MRHGYDQEYDTGINSETKRNKKKMKELNDNKINNRSWDEAVYNNRKDLMNVDRIMMERSFGSNEHLGRMNSDEQSDDELYGELTGEKMMNRDDIFHKGMPVRSNFSSRKPKFDDCVRSDFDLYEKVDKNRKHNVSYNEDNTGEYSDINESLRTITKGDDPYENCISGLNNTSCWLYNVLSNIINDSVVVNGYSLFGIFSILYLTINNSYDIKEYFEYPEKRQLHAGLKTINEVMNSYRHFMKYDNYMLIDSNITCDTNKLKRLMDDGFMFGIRINSNNIKGETIRLNRTIEKVNKIDDLISQNTIFGIKNGVSMITVAKINPKWYYQISKINKRPESKAINDGNYGSISFYTKSFNYYEDTEIQLIEIPLENPHIVFGFIAHKQKNNQNTDIKRISSCINYVKNTVLDEVTIPIIKRRYKMRLNGTLTKSGLKNVFTRNHVSTIFPEGFTVNDCLQYIDLEMTTETARNKINNNKGIISSRKFPINNNKIEFYIRETQHNIIPFFAKL